MKLLRIKITDKEGFRSLHSGFEHKFCENWNIIADRGVIFSHDGSISPKPFEPYICSGENGSGKSNVLEALAEIFFQLEKLRVRRYFLPDFYKEDEVVREDYKYRLDAYELEYSIWNGEFEHFIKVIKVPTTKDKNGQNIEPITIRRSSSDTGEQDVEVKPSERDEMLPEYILGYSSGENEILSLPFFKMRFIQYDEYWNALSGRAPYAGKPETRMAYLDSSFSQAILLTNILMYNEDELSLYKDLIDLEKFNSFRIILKETVMVDKETAYHFYKDSKNSPNFNEISSENQDTLYEVNILDILESLDTKESNHRIIDKLKNCATCQFYEESTKTLYLDYWVNDATKEAFRENFSYYEVEGGSKFKGNPLELFQAFQVLLTLNLYTVSNRLKNDIYASNSIYVNETVPTLASEDRVMRFKHVYFKKRNLEKEVMVKSLSDGEHQLLHSLGLCLLFKNSNCLFLFDEPETHFNPRWRSDFISNLNACFKDSTGYREMLITTHSPFLISDSKPEKVLVFDKTDEKVTVNPPGYNTFGASINQITMKTFGEEDTIGAIAQSKLKEFLDRSKNGEDSEALVKAMSFELGDSIEKSMIISEILEAKKK
ncbi:restriction system-associated AAA family ATPase [Rubritalea sp.]|uniref:restriction system-associated AAA family ATPase n=1 Tax=Rubritalea sp. TaxID=2109375 RepID=UPI003EF6E015